MLALVVVLPYVLYPIFLMRVLTAALFACAFNLMIGYVGLLSFGHAAFYGMGAYLAAWAMKTWHLDAIVCIGIGGATGAILGLFLGYLAIRRSGIYFAMITLALAQMVYFFCIEAPFTGGEDGIQQVPRGYAFGFIPLNNDMNMYWLTAGIFLAGFLLVHRIIHSPFGQVLKAIRENEPRATSLGYRTNDYKLIAFVLSTALSGDCRSDHRDRVRDRHTGWRALLALRGGGADHAAGRIGHGVRAGGRSRPDHRHGELPGAVRRLGHGDPRRDLRGLRTGVPPRHRGRDRGAAEAVAVTRHPSLQERKPGRGLQAGVKCSSPVSPVRPAPSGRTGLNCGILCLCLYGTNLMDRRTFVASLTAISAASPLLHRAANAQPAPKYATSSSSMGCLQTGHAGPKSSHGFKRQASAPRLCKVL